MARAPSAPGKTRLAAHVSPSRLRDLRVALLADTLRVVRAVPDVDRWIIFTPDDAADEVAAIGGTGRDGSRAGAARDADDRFALLAQRGDDLGERMRAAFDDLLVGRGCDAVLLVGSDIPLLRADQIATAVRALRGDDRRIVVGPADDGGYYLIGMSSPAAELFVGIEWGSRDVLRETLAAAQRVERDVRLVEAAYDVDTVDDLARLEHDLTAAPSDVAPHVRAWFAAGRAGS
jgi:hypothetical protein